MNWLTFLTGLWQAITAFFTPRVARAKRAIRAFIDTYLGD